MPKKKTAVTRSRTAVKAFISYSNHDRDLLEELVEGLHELVDEGLLTLNYDLTLEAGADWSEQLPRLLSESSIVLFLVSPDSLSSRYVEREVEEALSQRDNKRIIPIVLRPCDWFGSVLAKFNALPRGAKPITTWENRREAFLDIAKALRQVIESFQRTGASEGPGRHSGTVTEIAIAPDGRLAVSTGADGLAIVWNASELQPVGVLSGHTARITDVKVSPDGKLVATSSADRTIRIWNLGNLAEVLSLRGHRDTVTAISFSFDARTLISGSEDSTLRVWDLETGDCLQTYGATGPVTDIVPLPGKPLLVVAQSTQVTVLELSSRQIRASYSRGGLGLSITSDGSRVIVRQIDAFSVLSTDFDQLIANEAGEFNAVHYLPDGRHAIAAHSGGLQLWDLTAGIKVRSVSFGNDIPAALAVTTEGTLAVWGSTEGSVFKWQIDLSIMRELPVGLDRLRLAYLAVLESPQLWRVLETWDESAVSGIGAQLGIPSDQDLITVLMSRHPNTSPPPLWAAWMATLHQSKLGKAHEIS